MVEEGPVYEEKKRKLDKVLAEKKISEETYNINMNKLMGDQIQSLEKNIDETPLQSQPIKVQKTASPVSQNIQKTVKPAPVYVKPAKSTEEVPISIDEKMVDDQIQLVELSMEENELLDHISFEYLFNLTLDEYHEFKTNKKAREKIYPEIYVMAKDETFARTVGYMKNAQIGDSIISEFEDGYKKYRDEAKQKLENMASETVDPTELVEMLKEQDDINEAKSKKLERQKEINDLAADIISEERKNIARRNRELDQRETEMKKDYEQLANKATDYAASLKKMIGDLQDQKEKLVRGNNKFMSVIAESVNDALDETKKADVQKRFLEDYKNLNNNLKGEKFRDFVSYLSEKDLMEAADLVRALVVFRRCYNGKTFDIDQYAGATYRYIDDDFDEFEKGITQFAELKRIIDNERKDAIKDAKRSLKMINTQGFSKLYKGLKDQIKRGQYNDIYLTLCDAISEANTMKASPEKEGDKEDYIKVLKSALPYIESIRVHDFKEILTEQFASQLKDMRYLREFKRQKENRVKDPLRSVLAAKALQINYDTEVDKSGLEYGMRNISITQAGTQKPLYSEKNPMVEDFMRFIRLYDEIKGDKK